MHWPQRLGASVVIFAALAACGGSSDVGISDGGADSSGPLSDGPGAGEAPADGGVDARDATTDTRGDVANDVSDAAPGDSAVDVAAETGDASGDGAIDVSADVGLDTGIDAGQDSGLDAGDGGIVCQQPGVGEWYVAPSGSDVSGTGSQTCPFQTIAHAIAQLDAASPRTTIFVVSGAGSSNIYGAGCTAGPGGGSCDATPILVPPGIVNGLTIQGTVADPHLARVVGGTASTDTAVFLVRSPSVSFAQLSVYPRKLGIGAGMTRIPGADGIVFDAPPSAGAGEGSVTSVAVVGVVFGVTDSSGSGIRVRGGTSPAIGPAVDIVGGDYSVLVTDSPAGASAPFIQSVMPSPTFLHAPQFACVRVESLTAANAPPIVSIESADTSLVTFQDCGDGAVVIDTMTTAVAPTSSVASVLINASAATGANADFGIHLHHAGYLIVGAGGPVTIQQMNVAGIEATDTSQLELNGAVTVENSHGLGVHVTSTATATLNGLTSQFNGTTTEHHGLLCDSTGLGPNNHTLYLRNSKFLGNAGDGVLVQGPAGSLSGCVADLGAPAGAPAANTFNDTSQRNGVTGLCYLTPAGTLAIATGSTWSCGAPVGSGCNPGTPTAGATCAPQTDYSNGGTGNLMIYATGQTCCGP